jgi:cell division GTPase FtsZ
VDVLILGLGGGGGNILRSLKGLFQRDLQIAQKTDAAYARRLRRAVATTFLDTNEFSLSDIPPEERLLIGAGTTRRLGSRHDPDVAREALRESSGDVEALLSRHAAVILIGTGGKGTGAGTIFPIAQMARAQKKLVIPIFVRPSFERHEVEKRRYDHALNVVERFDAAQIRLIEILNDRGYLDRSPLPQTVVWERMNLPIARGLRGLLYVLEDLSQVDPSDLSTLFAGAGRLRLGFSEIDPPAGPDPSEAQIDEAVRGCWEHPYDAFGLPAGTSLICIQGHWSNVVDARIKGKLAVLASSGAADSPYNPLYARAIHTPRPWGITGLFAEHTGAHPPLEIAWPFKDHVAAPSTAVHISPAPPEAAVAAQVSAPAIALALPERESAPTDPNPRAFGTFWEFALAVNRGDASALALAGNGSDGGVSIDAAELRKLLCTVWFRSVFPRLSTSWRDRLFEVVVDRVRFENQLVKLGRQCVPLSKASYSQLNDIIGRVDLPDPVRADVQVLIAVGRLWGEEALQRCQFTGEAPVSPSRFGMLVLGLRG